MPDRSALPDAAHPPEQASLPNTSAHRPPPRVVSSPPAVALDDRCISVAGVRRPGHALDRDGRCLFCPFVWAGAPLTIYRARGHAHGAHRME